MAVLATAHVPHAQSAQVQSLTLIRTHIHDHIISPIVRKSIGRQYFFRSIIFIVKYKLYHKNIDLT